MSGKNPELQVIERSWPHLTAAQKEDLNTMAQQWSKRNKALGLSDGAPS
ncbi:MAG: hypothetical protein NTV52_03100 [Acidobacteria bacterium]|nr:hypothetical protein [Acidobacteriota bacterium]